MRKIVFKNAKIGGITGLAGTIMYAIFATIIELPIAIILWHPPIFHIIAVCYPTLWILVFFL